MSDWITRVAADPGYVALDHNAALALAEQYAREHNKPFVVVGTPALGFGPVAEEDLAELRALYTSFSAQTGNAPLATTYRVRPDGQLSAA